MRVYEFERFRFDPADGRLASAGRAKSRNLRPQVARLLLCFLQRPQTVIDRESLYRQVWGEQAVVDFESGLAALLRELRQALDEVGGGAELIETVPRRGYRLRAEVASADRSDAAVVAASGSGRWIVVAVAVLFAAVIAFVAWRMLSPAPQASSSSHSLAILPFERFGDAERLPEHADLLLADSLLASLWRVELDGLELIGRSGLRPYADRDDVATAVAADLGVNLLIEGTLQQSPEGWQVDARLLEIPPGRVVWSQSLAGQDQALPVAASAQQLAAQLSEDWLDLKARLSQPTVSE